LGETSSAYRIESYATGDSYRCRYRHYPSAHPGGPRARVVCIHGVQSHAGWYEYSCTRLSRAGFTVDFLDRRGSGMNATDRGDAPNFRRLLDDLADFLGPLRKEASQIPVFLLAISWGGKLAVGLQRRRPGLVDGLALLCPGFFPLVRPSRRERLAIAWSRLVAPRRLFLVPLDEAELFTATVHWQQFIRDDPLGLRRATARFLIESVRLDYYLRAAWRSVRVPVLLMLAGKDRIIDNDRTRRFVERLPTPDREILDYAVAAHTLEFEPDPDVFVGDLERWLDRQCRSRQGTP
jgi:alpha-beta hydrolase superfamily lysophospholipase